MSGLRDIDAKRRPDAEAAARRRFEAEHPGHTWTDQPQATRMAWRAASTERANPGRCVECGTTADNHPDGRNARHQFTRRTGASA